MDVQFLPDIEMECNFCDGTRYSNNVDNILYNNYSIKDVMKLTIRQALEVFKEIRR